MPRLTGLREQHGHQLALIGYVTVGGFGLHLGEAAGWRICLWLIAAVGALAGVASYRRARAIADIATSRIGSAAQGYVEVTGQAKADPSELIFTPYSQIACIWYRYRVYSREEPRGEWRQIDSGSSHTTFEISDGTGSCRVDPEHAEVMAPEQRVTYRDGDKLVEEMLFAGSPIYVLGEYTTVRGDGEALSVSADVSELLAHWKSDPVQLKKRFDLNDDGEIDLHEWELARRLATKTVERQHREVRQLSELNILRAPRDGRMFLISTLPPHKTRRRYLCWSALHLAVATLAMGAQWAMKG
ncbi:MAG: hypothetical protein K2Q07_04530 [Burkholderiaceae bacterium]|nr:hypothetical protein [Burkholderiaceae bacterium]